MSKARYQHAKCSIVDCRNQHKILFIVPASSDTTVRNQNNTTKFLLLFLPSYMYVGTTFHANFWQYEAKKPPTFLWKKGLQPSVIKEKKKVFNSRKTRL